MKKLSNNDKMLLSGGAISGIAYWLGVNPPGLLMAVPGWVAVVMVFLLGVGLTFTAYEVGK